MAETYVVGWWTKLFWGGRGSRHIHGLFYYTSWRSCFLVQYDACSYCTVNVAVVTPQANLVLMLVAFPCYGQSPICSFIFQSLAISLVFFGPFWWSVHILDMNILGFVLTLWETSLEFFKIERSVARANKWFSFYYYTFWNGTLSFVLKTVALGIAAILVSATCQIQSPPESWKWIHDDSCDTKTRMTLVTCSFGWANDVTYKWGVTSSKKIKLVSHGLSSRNVETRIKAVIYFPIVKFTCEYDFLSTIAISVWIGCTTVHFQLTISPICAHMLICALDCVSWARTLGASLDWRIFIGVLKDSNP